MGIEDLLDVKRRNWIKTEARRRGISEVRLISEAIDSYTASLAYDKRSDEVPGKDPSSEKTWNYELNKIIESVDSWTADKILSDTRFEWNERLEKELDYRDRIDESSHMIPQTHRDRSAMTRGLVHLMHNNKEIEL